MVRSGILGEDDRYELIEGDLVEMSSQSEEHAFVVGLVQDRLVEVFQGRAHVRVQLPLRASERSLPEPDLAVIRGARRATPRHPLGAQALLVVEVASTSLDADHDKAALYARAGVPVYWIVDIAGRHVEVHEEPVDGVWQRVTVLSEQAELTVPEVGMRWRVGELLP